MTIKRETGRSERRWSEEQRWSKRDGVKQINGWKVRERDREGWRKRC